MCSGCFSVTRGPSQSGAARKAAWSAIVGEGAGRAKRARRKRPGQRHQRPCVTRSRSVRAQLQGGMGGEYLHDDVEIGLADAAFQRVQLGGDSCGIEHAGARLFFLQPGTGGRHPERGAAVCDVRPVHRGGCVPGQCAIAAVEQVIQRIQAGAEFPVLVGHEHAIDLGIEAGDVVDGASVQHQGGAGHARVRACRGRVHRALVVEGRAVSCIGSSPHDAVGG